jgi:3-mercaptopyruvate sulfurtransferase SseA
MKRKTRKKSNAIPLPMILIGLGVLLVVGVLAWQGIRASTAASQGREVPVEAIERVTLASSKAAFDEQSAVFLDVRDSDSYNAGHIPGAINIPLALLENRASELDADQWIITYCT